MLASPVEQDSSFRFGGICKPDAGVYCYVTLGNTSQIAYQLWIQCICCTIAGVGQPRSWRKGCCRGGVLFELPVPLPSYLVSIADMI